MIIDGKKIAQWEFKKLTKEIAALKTPPCLCAFLVWNNSSSLRYIAQKKKWAQKVGITFILEHLKESTPEKTLLKKIQEKNTDPNIHGVMVQLPLPQHIESKKVIEMISSQKDVDGFHPINQWKIVIGDDSGFIPCTPNGIMYLLSTLTTDLGGKSVTVIWRSNIVGKPVINLLINQWATVMCCNSKTKNIAFYTKNADIVIVAAWSPKLLKASMLKKKAIVIDVWFTVKDGKIYGDADFKNIEKSGHSITPVPGWVWAMTVLHLMKNTLKAYHQQVWKKKNS